MHIEILSFLVTGSDDISVTFRLSQGGNESKQSFVISAEAYAELRLRRGESDVGTYEKVEREAGIYEAFKRGVASLGYGFCSASMLISKLRAKGYSLSVASEAVERIVERGYLDELENAKREAEKCLQKLWGERRIRAKLYEKRYRSDAIDGALFYLEDSGVDFDENCKSFIDSRYELIPENAQDMQKLIASVTRQGYSVSQIRSACLSLRDKKKIDFIYK